MDDSDEYFNDSFELDDDDLAQLAAEEAKHVQSVSQVSAKRTASPPPVKRQKTRHSQIIPIEEDIPEIVLRSDGTYGVNTNGKSRVSKSGNGTPPCSEYLSNKPQVTARPTQSIQLTDQVSLSRPRSKTPAGNTMKSQAESTVSSQSKAFTLPLRTSQRSQPPRMAAATPPLHGSNSLNPIKTAILADSELQKEIAVLRAQLEDLNREYVNTKEALKEAEVARFAKDGEVSILRVNIEKAGQQRAADLAALAEAKEKAEAERVRIQNEMMDQMERLRTEFAFKHHELESSSRKPMYTARSKRVDVAHLPSPIPLPAAMQNWASSDAANPSGSNPLKDSPSQRRAPLAQKHVSTKSPRAIVKGRLAAPELKFPGFENSFLRSSPLRSPSKRIGNCNVTGGGTRTPRRTDKKRSGKEPARDSEMNRVFSPVRMPPLDLRRSPRFAQETLPADDYIQEFDVDMEIGDGSPRRKSQKDLNGSSPAPELGGSSPMIDSDFQDDADKTHAPEDENFQGIDWRDEIHYLLFTHNCNVSSTLTFHYLLSASVPTDMHDHARMYQESCSAILETLGAKYKYDTLEKLMARLAKAFVSMAAVLWKVGYLAHLRALFDLLTSAVVFIPAFAASVLHSAVSEGDRTTKLLTIVCEIARRSLNPKDLEKEGFKFLIYSALKLAEIVAWSVPEQFAGNLAIIMRSNGVLSNLLDDRQPDDVIAHTLKLLVVIATHFTLSRYLVNVPDLDEYEQLRPDISSDPSRIPLLERLCDYLMKPKPRSTDIDCNNVAILNFFALLCAASPNSRSALTGSVTVVPCLVHYLTRLTILIWEDDERTMYHSDLAASTVLMINQTLQLLHRLVFVPRLDNQSTDEMHATTFDLRYKLYHAPHTLFNGLAHMFTVMIGRLSYAEPPDWLSSELQTEIERATEPARDLMDLIIEGPEGDSVWAAYQEADRESVTEDDDEVEARLHIVDEPE